jgi:hypothetical protein
MGHSHMTFPVSLIHFVGNFKFQILLFVDNSYDVVGIIRMYCDFQRISLQQKRSYSRVEDRVSLLAAMSRAKAQIILHTIRYQYGSYQYGVR